MKKEKRSIILILLLFLGYAALEYFAPKPLDWTPSYSSHEKIPYGSFVFHNLLKEALPDQKLLENSLNFNESLDKFRKESPLSIIIIDQIFNPDAWETKRLLKAAEEGNTIFISAYQLGESISDSLKLHADINPFDSILFTPDSSRLRLVNPAFPEKGEYVFRTRLTPCFFAKFDSSGSIVLGTDARQRANFIIIPHGEGKILVHLQPLVFTNYHLLYDKPDYTYAILSYLPQNTILWDEYYKPGKGKSGSPIRFILNQPALKAAWYLIIFLVMAFMITQSRRQQWVIPIITPPRNTTIDYAEVLGQLYFNQGDHAALALKKFHHFVEFCRTNYYLGSGVPDEKWISRLILKSGIPAKNVLKIFDRAEEIRGQKSISAEILNSMNSEIEEFYALANKAKVIVQTKKIG
jgi:hypothetical protein